MTEMTEAQAAAINKGGEDRQSAGRSERVGCQTDKKGKRRRGEVGLTKLPCSVPRLSLSPLLLSRDKCLCFAGLRLMSFQRL